MFQSFNVSIFQCLNFSILQFPFSPSFRALEADARLVVATVEDIVAEGDTYAGGTEPVPAVLASLEG